MYVILLDTYVTNAIKMLKEEAKNHQIDFRPCDQFIYIIY